MTNALQTVRDRCLVWSCLSSVCGGTVVRFSSACAYICAHGKKVQMMKLCCKHVHISKGGTAWMALWSEMKTVQFTVKSGTTLKYARCSVSLQDVLHYNKMILWVNVNQGDLLQRASSASLLMSPSGQPLVFQATRLHADGPDYLLGAARPKPVASHAHCCLPASSERWIRHAVSQKGPGLGPRARPGFG